MVYFGWVDVLYNNVGIVEVGGLVEISEESWNWLVVVNQISLFFMYKYVLFIMEQQRKGVIVNIFLMVVLCWIGFFYLGYMVIKVVILVFIKNVVMQYVFMGICVNCVLFGMMDMFMICELFKVFYGGDIEEMCVKCNVQCLMGFMGDVWDVVYVLLFLVFDCVCYIMGLDMIVDGGLLLCCVG